MSPDASWLAISLPLSLSFGYNILILALRLLPQIPIGFSVSDLALGQGCSCQVRICVYVCLVHTTFSLFHCPDHVLWSVCVSVGGGT